MAKSSPGNGEVAKEMHLVQQEAGKQGEPGRAKSSGHPIIRLDEPGRLPLVSRIQSATLSPAAIKPHLHHTMQPTRAFPLLAAAAALAATSAQAAVINVGDHSFIPDGSATSAYQQTNIATPNGGNVLPSGAAVHVAYFVTTFTFGENSDAHLQANFRATGGQPRVGVEIQDTGAVLFVGTGDTTQTNFNFNQDMAGQTVVLLVKAHYDPNHNVVYGKANSADDTLFNVWINPTASSVEGSGQSAGDMQTVWNSATFGFFGQTIQNQSTPGTAGDSFITNTVILTGTDATFANALAIATIPEPSNVLLGGLGLLALLRRRRD